MNKFLRESNKRALKRGLKDNAIRLSYFAGGVVSAISCMTILGVVLVKRFDIVKD